MTEDRALFLAKTNLPESVIARLDGYAALLEKWNPKINLVAPSTVATVWTRHFLDSVQLWDWAPDTARSWVDLGSGGGFPGLVLAMVAKDLRPELHITLVESDQRKAAFMRTVSRETQTPVTILAERIESVKIDPVDIVSARALAPLPKLLAYAHPLLSPTGRAIFPKGAHHQSELAAALANWTFTLQKEPSQSHPDSAVLCIGDLARV